MGLKAGGGEAATESNLKVQMFSFITVYYIVSITESQQGLNNMKFSGCQSFKFYCKPHDCATGI